MTSLRETVLGMAPELLPELLEQLPPRDAAEVRRIIESATDDGWRSTPATMAHELTEGAYRLWPYVKLLGRRFASAFNGTGPAHQMWNLPSQYGKTTLLGVWGPVWALDLDPTLRLMFVSYDADKAWEEAGKARDLAEAHAGRLRFRLRRDQRARGLWRTEQGGGLYAVGMRGAITGFPADALLLDDLLKGWQAAHSHAERDFVWNVWRSQLRLRVQGGHCPIIMSGTRWHEDDYFARALAAAEADEHADQFDRLVLPAIAEEDDPLGRAPGEALEAERFPVSEVLSRRATLGSYLWSAMEQQRPAPEEGGEVKRSWWRWESTIPDRFDDMLSSWDPKLKDSEMGDFVVGQVWGRTGSDFWCIDQLRGQWNFTTTKLAVALMAVRHPRVSRHYVEATGVGPEVMQNLKAPSPGYEVDEQIGSQLGMTADERAAVQLLVRQGIPGLLPVNPKGSKSVRLRAVSGLIEAGNVHLPERASWAPGLVDEAAAFPNGAHDDQVDTLSQALSKLSRGKASVKVATGRVTRAPVSARPPRTIQARR